ncbi:Kinetochore-associated protein 1 [Chamberlinius hualienensis]
MEWKVQLDIDTSRAVKYAELNCQKASTYDVKAVSTFIGDQKSSSETTVRTRSTADTVCVAIDYDCFVFNGTLQNLEHNFHFDACISCVAIRTDGKFILIGSNDGTISLIYRPQKKCIFTRPLVTDDTEDSDLAICSAVFTPDNLSTGISEIMIATNSGRVFHLGNINFSLFQSTLDNGDEKSIFELLSQIDQSEITIQCTDIKCLQVDGRNMFLLSGDGVSLVVKEKGCDVEVWQSIDRESFLGASIIKSVVFNKCHYALLLDDGKKLHLVCLRTFIVVSTFNELSVEDFTIFENMDQLGIYDVKIVVLTKLDETTTLQICSLPSLKIQFSLPVYSSTCLIDTSVNTENLFFFEKENEELTTDSITVYNVSEASHQARLMRLIAMRNFNEALSLAKTNLDVELVFKSKLTVILEQLDDSNDQQLTSTIKDWKSSLYECFDQISDLNMVVDYCMNMSLPSLFVTKEILFYAKSKINKNFEFHFENVAKFFDTLKRLETFSALYDEHQDSRMFRTMWGRFRFVSLWDELITYLRNGKISSVSLIWARHCEELLSTMTGVDEVNYLLESIPEISVNVSLQEWIKQSLLPVILLKIQGSINSVASWIIYRCHLMEFNDSCNWPANAISFAKMFIDVCKELSSTDSMEVINFSMDLAILMAQEISLQNSVLRQIRVLMDTLRDLHQLKHQFNCKISMVNYSQDDKRLVVYYLFDGIYLIDNIPEFIELFLTPFAKHNSLNIDTILAQYIQDVLDCTEIDWRYWEEAPWEKQVVNILNCIRCDESRYETLCQVLKASPVPWSANIQKLVENSLKSNHPLVQHIKNEKANELRRVIMRKYGFCQNDHLDYHTGNILICHILTSNTDDEALSDALCIAEAIQKDAIDVYLFRMRHLIKIGQMNSLYPWLERISTSISVPCCKRLAMFVSGLLCNSYVRDELLIESLNFTSAAIYCLQFVRQRVNTFEFEEYQELLNILLKSQTLQEFGVLAPLNFLTSPQNSMEIFSECIKSFLANEELLFRTLTKVPKEFKNERKGGKSKSSLRDLFRLANILNISKMLATKLIVQTALERNMYGNALECLEILCDDYSNKCQISELTKLLFYIFETLCSDKQFQNFDAILQYLDNLKIALTKTSFICDSDEIKLVAWALQWIYMVQHLFHISNIGSDLGSFNYWAFTRMYQETTIYLDKSKVLSLISSIINYAKQVEVENLFACEESLLVVLTDLVQYLSSRGRILLALYLQGIILNGACSSALLDSHYESVLITAAQNSISFINSLLKSLFIQKKLDYMLALGAILSLPKSISISYLQLIENKYGCDYGKLLIIATLAIEVHCRWCVYDKLQHYKTLITEANWGKTFSRLHINYKDYFKKSAVEKMKLISILAVDNRVNLKLIEEFSAAFGLDTEAVLIQLLQVLLMATLVDTEAQNKRNVNEALSLCSLIVEHISSVNEDQDVLLSTFDSIFPKMNPYNYEAISFILNARINCASNVERALKSLELLTFLRSYERRSKPCDFEMPLFFESSVEVYLYHLKRLPFHYLLDPLKVTKLIVNELAPDTLSSWMKVSHILSIKQNDMIMITIESIVKQVMPNLEASKSLSTNMQWMENVNTKKVFLTMHNLLRCIDDLEKVTVCLISILKRLPPGIWKELSVNSAISFTEKWLETSKSEKAATTLQILKTMHRNLFIEKLFYELQFDSKCIAAYSSMKEMPEELLGRIFDHESILNRYWFDSERYPDIFSACRKLANLYNLNFENLCMSLICKWLLPSEGIFGGCLDETLTMDLNFAQANESNVDISVAQGNKKRAIYLMNNLNSDQCAEHLAAMMRSSVSSVRQADRLNYLSCLLHTIDVKSLGLLVGLDANELRITAKQFYVGVQLESLNLSYLMEELTELSVVKNLIVHLIQNYGHLPAAANFAAELCLDCKIFDVELWDSILKNMISLNLVKSLVCMLRTLSVCPSILKSLMYKEAWKGVLMTKDTDNERFGLGVLILMQQCPILEELDLINLANYYEEASLPLVVVECYRRVTYYDGYNKITAFVKGAVAETIINQIIVATKQVGYMYHLNEIKNSVILAMTSNGTLQNMRRSSYKQWFQENVFKDAHLNTILLHAAQMQKWDECGELIKCREDANCNTMKHSSVDAKHLVKMYAESHDLEVLLKLVT